MKSNKNDFMKRIICILIIVATLFLISCNKAPEQKKEPLSEYQRWLYSHPQGEYDNTNSELFYDWECPSFDYVMDRITDVVKATYKTSWQVDPSYMEDPDYIHEFEVLEYLRGEKQEKTVYVYENPSGWDGHSTYDIEYEKGKSYLLLLRRDITPFENGPKLTSVAYEMYIPLTADRKIDTLSSRYCRFSLEEKIKDEALKAALLDGNFAEALLEKIKENPYKLNHAGFIEETDMESILKRSEQVVRVKITKSHRVSENYFSEIYNMRVKAVYKGDCNVGDTNLLILPRDFQEGEYIIAIQRIYQKPFSNLFGDILGSFVITSKNSIYEIEAEENVKVVLSELEK